MTNRSIAKRDRAVRLAASSEVACMFGVEGLEDRRLLSAAIVAPQLCVSSSVQSAMQPSFRLNTSSPLGLQNYASTGPVGLTPLAIRHAYGMDNVLFGSITGDGSGQTIAIVDAYDAPSIVSDLATFNSTFGLPTSAFVRLNQNKQVISDTGTNAPPADTSNRGNSWALESSLDVEWAHAVAPKATIVLVEANSNSNSDLFKAIDVARSYGNVSAVSMSWGGGEWSGQSAYDQYFSTPSGHNGVTFMCSSGDSGAGASYPASSPKVIGVGGTTLSLGSNNTWSSESAWSGSGGGLSSYYSQPSYQVGTVIQSTTRRAIPDVALDASPASGVAVIDSWDLGASTPWLQVGGTSLACPLWAGVIAIANQGRALNGLGTLDGSTQTLPLLYQLPSSDFHDITSGSNGYSAGAGYDLVTGRGTPIVNLVATALAGTPIAPTPVVGSLSVSPASVLSGASVTLTASNVVETNGTITGVTFYRESNGTAGLQSTDTVVGPGTQSGSTWTLSGVSTAGLSAGTYTFYAVATDASNVSGSPAQAVLTVTVPTPVIGSLTVSPSSVLAGATVTLTASNVTETGGTVNAVNFYRDSNGAAGLQTASDTLVGTGSQNGSTWTIATSTSGLAPGTYTYYALATDTVGVNSAVSQVTLAITAPAPANDIFANAIAITGTSASVTGSNVNATKQSGEPSITTNRGGKSVWWAWQATSSGTVSLDTRGSNFDTMLGVFTGTAVNALTKLASNDDISRTVLQSALTFNAVTGTTYYFDVDGYNGASGNITLNISQAAPVVAPANDLFANATAITTTASAPTVALTGANVGATKESGEPATAGNVGGASVWYSWTAPTSRLVTLNTRGSNFDTLLAVYTGSTLTNLTPVAANDDDPAGGTLTSALSFNAVAGTSYRFVVDGYNGATGNITLNLL